MFSAILLKENGLRDYGTAQWDGGDAACDHEARANRADRPRNGLTGGLDTIEAATIYRDTCGKCGAVRIDRQIGLEASPSEYLATMVAVFREVKRVLRPDGTCWVNIGDSFCSGTSAPRKPTSAEGADVPASWSTRSQPERIAASPGLAAKQLLLMPARLALALQADGWWVRSDIIWHKPNPMPESCTDRPTSAHEHVFLLTKSARYFYDNDAVREQHRDVNVVGGAYVKTALSAADYEGRKWADRSDGISRPPMTMRDREYHPAGRNLRNVWTIATSPFSAAHFATFPPELAERCIRAGTSERGCCAVCGKPWVRVTETDYRHHAKWFGDKQSARHHRGPQQASYNEPIATRTTGWSPSCTCDLLADLERPADPVPCTVLDPFAGAGTTLLVADRLQRDAIGIELNTAYTEMAMERCRADAPLFADMHPPPAEPPEDARMADLFADLAAD